MQCLPSPTPFPQTRSLKSGLHHQTWKVLSTPSPDTTAGPSQRARWTQLCRLLAGKCSQCRLSSCLLKRGGGSALGSARDGLVLLMRIILGWLLLKIADEKEALRSGICLPFDERYLHLWRKSPSVGGVSLSAPGGRGDGLISGNS